MKINWPAHAKVNTIPWDQVQIGAVVDHFYGGQSTKSVYMKLSDLGAVYLTDGTVVPEKIMQEETRTFKTLIAALDIKG